MMTIRYKLATITMNTNGVYNGLRNHAVNDVNVTISMIINIVQVNIFEYHFDPAAVRAASSCCVAACPAAAAARRLAPAQPTLMFCVVTSISSATTSAQILYYSLYSQITITFYLL